MHSHEISNKQMQAWLMAGLSAPIALLAAECSWPWVLLIGLASGAALRLVSKIERIGNRNKWLLAVETIWLTVILGSVCRWTQELWPLENGKHWIPIILLAFATAAAKNGEERAARTGSTLLWLLAIGYAAVLLAGLTNLNVEQIQMDMEQIDLRIAEIMLIPALCVFLKPQKTRSCKAGYWYVLVLAIVISLLVNAEGSMGGNTFFRWGRGMRFEAILLMVISMGWFALYSFLQAVEWSLLENIRQGTGSKGIWITAAAAVGIIFLPEWISHGVLLIGTVSLWIIFPTGYGMLKNKSKK